MCTSRSGGPAARVPGRRSDKTGAGSQVGALAVREERALGHEISPSILAKLDSGHRGSVPNVTEPLVLAAALNIPPVLLPSPGYPEGNIKFHLGHTAPCKQVADWFLGRGRLPLRPAGESEISPWNLGTKLVQAAESCCEAGRNTLAAQTMSDAPIRAEILRGAEQQLVRLAACINGLCRELQEEN